MQAEKNITLQTDSVCNGFTFAVALCYFTESILFFISAALSAFP